MASLVEALTDNRNRPGAGVRHIFTKHAGTLGEPGSVAYLFEKRGVVVVDASRWSEDDLEPAIDAGATQTVMIEKNTRIRLPHGEAMGQPGQHGRTADSNRQRLRPLGYIFLAV